MKLVAAFNAMWIVATCFFQFTNFYDNCYCNSAVFGRRKAAYNVIVIVFGDASRRMWEAWIGGTFLGSGVAIVFVAFVVLYINPPLPKELDSQSQTEDSYVCRCH